MKVKQQFCQRVVDELCLILDEVGGCSVFNEQHLVQIETVIRLLASERRGLEIALALQAMVGKWPLNGWYFSAPRRFIRRFHDYLKRDDCSVEYMVTAEAEEYFQQCQQQVMEIAALKAKQDHQHLLETIEHLHGVIDQQRQRIERLETEVDSHHEQDRLRRQYIQTQGKVISELSEEYEGIKRELKRVKANEASVNPYGFFNAASQLFKGREDDDKVIEPSLGNAFMPEQSRKEGESASAIHLVRLDQAGETGVFASEEKAVSSRCVLM